VAPPESEVLHRIKLPKSTLYCERKSIFKQDLVVSFGTILYIVIQAILASILYLSPSYPHFSHVRALLKSQEKFQLFENSI
jgi:hypothetical protein